MPTSRRSDATADQWGSSPPGIIALAGDWHGDLPFARSVIKYCARSKATRIIHLGDFSIWPGRFGAQFLAGVSRALTMHDMYLDFVDGNHEDFWQLYALPLDASGRRPVGPRIWHLPRGYRWTWGSKTWTALGGAVSLDKKRRVLGKSWWPEEAITTAEMEKVIADGHTDVLLTHDCPSRVLIPRLLPESYWDAEMMVHAKAHRAMLTAVANILQPTYLMHGHFHVRYQDDVIFGRKRCTVVGLASNEQQSIADNTLILDLDTL